MRTPILLVVAAVAAAPASAVVVDFSNTPPDLFDSYSESGATFTALEGLQLTSDLFGNTPNGTRGLISNGPPHIQHDYVPIRADFDLHQSFVAVDIGDFDADSETLFLRAYDANDTLVAETTEFIDDQFTGMRRLEVSAPGIAYAVFGGQDGLNGSSVYADNVEFIPAPGPVALAAASGLGLLRRRRPR